MNIVHDKNDFVLNISTNTKQHKKWHMKRLEFQSFFLLFFEEAWTTEPLFFEAWTIELLLCNARFLWQCKKYIWRVQMQKPLSAIWNFLLNDHFYQACIFKFSNFT